MVKIWFDMVKIWFDMVKIWLRSGLIWLDGWDLTCCQIVQPWLDSWDMGSHDSDGVEPASNEGFQEIGRSSVLPSGKLLHSHWKWPFMVDLRIYPLKMVIFHSYVNVYQRVNGKNCLLKFVGHAHITIFVGKSDLLMMSCRIFAW